MWSSVPGLKKKMFYVTKTKECRGKKKRCLSIPPPWEFQIPISSSRALDPFFLFGDPGLLINLPRNLLSRLHQLIFQLVLPYTLYFTTGVLSIFLYKASSFTYWEYFILSLFLKGISQGDALLSLIASVVHSSWNYNVITYPIFKNNRSMLSLISFNTLIRCLPH